jgi:hypothetical protein
MIVRPLYGFNWEERGGGVQLCVHGSARLKYAYSPYTYCSNQRLCIPRPAALSAICLSWLGRIWNLGEGGPLCVKQASQDNRFCTVTVCSTESTALAGLLRTQRTTFTKISIFSQHFLSRSYFSLASSPTAGTSAEQSKYWYFCYIMFLKSGSMS